MAVLPFSRPFSSWHLSHSWGLLPAFPSKWWAKFVVRPFSMSLSIWEGLCSSSQWEYFLQCFRLHSSLLYLVHLGGMGGGKKVKYWDTLKSVSLPSFGFSLFLELSLHDPGFLSQLLAQGQILNLGLDNKSTAEVILTPLKSLSALWCARNETHNSF